MGYITEPFFSYYDTALNTLTKRQERVLIHIYKIWCEKSKHRRPHPDVIALYPHFYPNKK